MMWMAFSPSTVSETGKGSPSDITFLSVSKSEFWRVWGKHTIDKGHISPNFASFNLFPLGPPPASPDVPVVPTKPNSPEPELSLMCSPDLSFDAVSTLRGEFLFFKDRSEKRTLNPYLLLVKMLRKDSNMPIYIYSITHTPHSLTMGSVGNY